MKTTMHLFMRKSNFIFLFFLSIILSCNDQYSNFEEITNEAKTEAHEKKLKFPCQTPEIYNLEELIDMEELGPSLIGGIPTIECDNECNNMNFIFSYDCEEIESSTISFVISSGDNSPNVYTVNGNGILNLQLFDDGNGAFFTIDLSTGFFGLSYTVEDEDGCSCTWSASPTFLFGCDPETIPPCTLSIIASHIQTQLELLEIETLCIGKTLYLSIVDALERCGIDCTTTYSELNELLEGGGLGMCLCYHSDCIR